MIAGLQVIAFIFSLIMIYFAYLHYRRGELNGLEILLWFFAWAGAIFVALFPEVFRIFSATIAISRAFDLAMIAGFMLVVPIVYTAYIRTKRLEKRLEEIIRKDALRGLNDVDKKGKSS